MSPADPSRHTIPLASAIRDVTTNAEVWFLDIWGVLHNGVTPFAAAVAACKAFRNQGGGVVLVSNSPRPRNGVVAQLDAIGVDRAAYDAVVTSGDVSRALIANSVGQAVLHIGPKRDEPLFDGLGVSLGDEASARAIVCTGLRDDETETPETYRGVLERMAAKKVELICANPDLAVERGGRMIPCAGAVAALYSDLGGRVQYAGKPYAPIYDAALGLAASVLGHDVTPDRVLAIGDGAGTDIAGALGYGIPAVYVASRVSMVAGETLSEAAARLFPDASNHPRAVMAALAW